MRKYLLLLAFCLSCAILNGNLAFTAPAEIIFSGVSPEVAKQFDSVNGALDPALQITSIADGAVIPNNYSYPLFQWRSPSKGQGIFLLTLHSKRHDLKVYVRGNSWQPKQDEFQLFMKDPEIEITIYQMSGDQTLRSKPVRVLVGPTPLTDRIVFRVVDPLFDTTKTNYIKALALDERHPMDLLELKGSCLGCHSYSPGLTLLNVKKDKERRLIISRDNQLFEQKRIGEFSFMAIAPDGRYAALVGNTSGKIVLKPDYIEPFDLPYETGDILIYDQKQNRLTPLEGASELDYVEDMPAFDPDGKRLIFTRYQYEDGSIKSMDLYEVPFHDGQGGGAEPVKNGSGNEQYNYLPSYSPDGKWISFCRGDAGKGMFARKSSDIYLLSRDQHKLLKLKFNQSEAMDSWHSWSSDSHWLVISSNREPSQLTALYLVYIDTQGRDYPPVKLVGDERMKVNTPQFIPGSVDLKSIKDLNDFLAEVFAVK